MARIKYVLNERRLGLIAAATPLVDRPAPHIPWSASGSSDPHAGVAAVRGEAPIPAGILSHEVAPVQSKVAEEAVVGDEQVAEEEVESRDEGWGGGAEAKQFVREVGVRDDGKVEKAL
jgi:large subunit ribosomal protein L47